MKSLSVSVRNSSKDFSTSITCLLRFGPNSAKKANLAFLLHLQSSPLYSISLITVSFDLGEVSSLIVFHVLR